MRIRHGFVSNSSSCSFLILGVEFTDELKEALQEYAGREDWHNDELLGSLETTCTESDKEYIGRYLHYVSSDDYDDIEVSTFKDVLDDKALQALMKIECISLEELKLISGTGMC